MTYIRPMLLSLLLVFTAASANAETIDDLVLKNGSYYKKLVSRLTVAIFVFLHACYPVHVIAKEKDNTLLSSFL